MLQLSQNWFRWETDALFPGEGLNNRGRILVCLVEDPATKRQQPRNYLETLEDRVRFLEGKLRESDLEGSTASPSNEPSTFYPRSSSEQHELSDLSSMIGTLSLSAAGAEPHYLGSSSVFAFARFVEPSLRQVVSSIPPDKASEGSNQPSMLNPCPLPEYQTAVRLSNAYFQNIHPQYPFLHEPTFRIWESALKSPLGPFEVLEYKSVPIYFLFMVYAVGALLLPTPGYSPERLYASALLYIDEILYHDNLECIQAILCSATYSLRSSKGTSHWKLAGQALRQCINLGYHRDHKRLRLARSQLQSELQKRAFWSAYSMECSASLLLGRPLSLRLQEIDADLPLDLEDSCFTETGLCESPKTPSEPPTMMTHAIHGFRFRNMLGRIHSTLYSDNTATDFDRQNAHIKDLLEELDKLMASRPLPRSPPDGGALSFFTTPDWYQAVYDSAILQLYRFHITDSQRSVPPDIITKCMRAAKSACHSYRRQFLGTPTTPTWGALHELFLAGLTYLYCLWKASSARDSLRHDQISSTCTDCTMVLVIMAERWKDAAPYRDVFEALASRTMTMIADKQQGKEAAPTWFATEQDRYSADLPEWMAGIADSGISLGVDLLLSGLGDDFSFSGTCEGGDESWDGTDVSTMYQL
uniref:Xylanolytic transcriptional activator regulatory domain-containing protein n=1 Tax=Bionectria ochroleuca TaxID=29856 RepID=A0A8H7KA26_BIOOC